jgi:anti-anti-sigma factor
MPIDPRPDGVVMVRLQDDPSLTDELESLAGRELPAHPGVVLDLSGVNYMNSSHLSRLLRARQRAVLADGRFVLCRVGGPLMGVFHATGLDKVFTLTDDEQTAVEWAKTSA